MGETPSDFGVEGEEGWRKMMVEQGRVKMDIDWSKVAFTKNDVTIQGGWSAQGVAYEEGDDKQIISPWLPMGELSANWKFCDSGECEPYASDHIRAALWEDWNRKTPLGEWAPPRITEIVGQGFDWAVWSQDAVRDSGYLENERRYVNYQDLQFLTMCRKCGCSIVGSIGDEAEEDPEMGDVEDEGEREIDWEPFWG